MKKFKSAEDVSFQEEFQRQFSEVLEILDAVFEIRNLSICERYLIGKIVKELGPLYKSSMYTDSQFCMDREVATLFLIRGYGIDPYYIEKFAETVEDEDTFKEFIRRTRERAHLI